MRDETLDLTIAHAEAPTLLRNLETGNSAAQVEVYVRLTERLVRAGASCVVVTSIAGHFCIDAFKKVSPLPVIDMIEAVNLAVEKRGLRRLGILGTLTVTQSHFYGGLSGTEIVVPHEGVIHDVHEAYVTMAAAGEVTPAQRGVFDATCDWYMQNTDIEGILLGGTDLALVYDAASEEYPIVDCAGIHVDAICS